MQLSLYMHRPFLKLQVQHLLSLNIIICVQEIFPSTLLSSSGKVSGSFEKIIKCEYIQGHC